MTLQLVEKYQKKLRHADETRKRMELLFSQGALIERDILAVYEGLFLRSVVGFEDLVETVFFQILEGRSHKSTWGCKISGPVASLRKCVLQDKNYLDWLPIDKTIDRSNIYLRGGKPFSSLDSDDKSKLVQVMAIRNAIAHPSASALAKFKKQVVGNTAIPHRERRPAPYLRGQSRPSTCRFEIFVQGLGQIANKFK